jgi:hypothetical protein
LNGSAAAAERSPVVRPLHFTASSRLGSCTSQKRLGRRWTFQHVCNCLPSSATIRPSRRNSTVPRARLRGESGSSRGAPRTAGLPGGVPPPQPEESTAHQHGAAARRHGPLPGPLPSPQAGARAERGQTPPTAGRVPPRRVAPGAAAGAAFKPTTTLRPRTVNSYARLAPLTFVIDHRN